MSNGPIEVQAYADWVAPNVEVHGVAAAIEHFLL
jgi:hydroxymethylpyrimidine pyrophosphatase-like HAD family hydrolase